ncbi:glycosyltransferase [Actinoplanes sp. NPDC049548]|uniref:glycosyltransferase n=1 Tax=Actinoplanes sp. NPDC049548 TaxID=3155152 RepID=UPI00342BE735
MKHLVMVAKSPWHPAIRREHALAAQATANGLHLDFIEAPTDIRRLGSSERMTWLRSFRPVPVQRSGSAFTTHSRSTLVPGHRNAAAAAVDNLLLRRTVNALCAAGDPSDTAVVVNVPWQWAATKDVVARRVFDAADDWNALLDGKRPHVRRMYQQIATEADTIIVANESLAALFPGREVVFVPNGAQSDLVGASTRPVGTSRRMVYVGTFSERFDADLVRDVMTRLPDWTLDLYGQFRYAGYGEEPAPEFAQLLEQFGPRIRWHGVVQRPEIAAVLDNAAVALVPHRPRYCRGQSSMKFLDYAARGRPVVSTTWETGLDRQSPPGVWFADEPASFARAVLAAADVDPATSASALAWARDQTWEQRWPKWAGAVFGVTADLSR